MTKKKSKATKKMVFKNCEGKCEICGLELHLDDSRCYDNDYLNIDHIDPDGPDSIDNYRALCRSCNSERGNVCGKKLITEIKKTTIPQRLDQHQRYKFLRDDVKNRLITKEDLERFEEEIIKANEFNLKVIKGLKCLLK